MMILNFCLRVSVSHTPTIIVDGCSFTSLFIGGFPFHLSG